MSFSHLRTKIKRGGRISKNLLILAGVLVFVLALMSGIFYYFKFSQNKVESPPTNTKTPPSDSKTSDKFSKKVFFVHHSTGEIYWNGGMEKALVEAGYEAAAPWWDGNTDPGDFYNEFSDSSKWQILEPYSIIIFKSCFPASAITSDEMLENYKTEYKKLYEIYQSHPDKLFVPLSTPPLLASSTDAESAKRALAFENWLLNDYKNEYAGKNLAPFGLHSLLSDEGGFLASQFVVPGGDDHPNAYSGQVVGSAMVDHLADYVN